MRHLPPLEASLAGYRAITKDVWPDLEPQVKASLEATLSSVDSVWIDMPYGAIQAARKRSELVLPGRAIEQLKKETL
jgi:hypothetical protein